jgi:hypothetical protein
MDGELRLAGRGSILFWEEAMARLTLREALGFRPVRRLCSRAADDGAELVTGSELERGLALLITQRRSLDSLGFDWNPGANKRRVSPLAAE